ncbi:hypothetical protein HN51_062159 [Arachis hypogaea]|uniref:protein FAM136A-like isoform X2 n=1 Tax=Arachis ipaensis TaxID=130454 RepID=UPI000A2B7AD2|nr:protein FAM136A-like isoform X2 [Arachis ipaensis]XP_025627475.1 protein FAM136A isoform X2 [Arachis hypogaea]
MFALISRLFAVVRCAQPLSVVRRREQLKIRSGVACSIENHQHNELVIEAVIIIMNRMDHFAGAEEHLAQQRLRQKLDEVNVAAQNDLAPIQDHVNFTLQKAYFKCAYECFDRSRRQEEITSCVENCSIPLANVQQTFDTEMQKFQEKLNRSLMVCQDRYESAKLQQKGGAMNDMVSCADEAIQDSIKMLPLLANKLKSSFGIKDNDSF